MANEAELERLVVRLVGDAVSYQKMLTDAQSSTIGAVDSVGAATDKMTASAMAAGAMAMQVIQEVSGKLKALSDSSLAEWGVAETAGMKLSAAISAGGHSVDQVMPKYVAFASEMQRLTTTGDDEVIQMLQMAESMGLYGDAAMQAAKNAIGLGSAIGISARGAMRYAVMAAQGNTEMLGRFIPTLRGITDESERNRKAQEMLGNMFNQASAEARTYTGQLQQMKNAVGDAKEQVGRFIAEAMIPQIQLTKQAAETFQTLNPSVIKTTGSIIQMGGTATTVLTLVAAFKLLGTGIKAIGLTPWTMIGAAAVGTIAAITAEIMRQRKMVEDAAVLPTPKYATPNVKNLSPETQKEVEELNKQRNLIRSAVATGTMSNAQIDAFGVQVRLINQKINAYVKENDAIEAKKKADEEALKTIKGLIEKREMEAKTFGMSSTEAQVYAAMQGKATEEQLKAARAIDEKIDALKRAKEVEKEMADVAAEAQRVEEDKYLEKYNAAMEKGKQLTDQYLTPQEKLLKTQKELDELLSVIGPSFKPTYDRALAAAHKEAAGVHKEIKNATSAMERFDSAAWGSAEHLSRMQAMRIFGEAKTIAPSPTQTSAGAWQAPQASGLERRPMGEPSPGIGWNISSVPTGPEGKTAQAEGPPRSEEYLRLLLDLARKHWGQNAVELEAAELA